jgi:hypothetical protein
VTNGKRQLKGLLPHSAETKRVHDWLSFIGFCVLTTFGRKRLSRAENKKRILILFQARLSINFLFTFSRKKERGKVKGSN